MEWISVKTKFPNQNQFVLCYSPGYDIFTAMYSREETYREPFYMDYWTHGFCCGQEPGDPTHWMPLPEPPKGE